MTRVKRLTAGVFLALACGGGTTVTPEPEIGDLVVTTLTVGHNLDPDGYTLTLDGSQTALIGISGSVTFPRVDAGHHTLELTDLADTCYLTRAQPVSASVRSGETTHVGLAVECLGIPNDVEIAFTRAKLDPDSSNILGMRRDGSGVVNLTNAPAFDREPAWSPDGTRLAFARGDTVYVVNADGTGLMALTAGRAPSWAPDGTLLAFHRPTRRAECSGTLHSVPATGGAIRDIGAGVEPSWSPDGTQIAFEACSPPETDIFVADADGGNARNLTGSEHVDREPAWSPDGTAIVFRRLNRSESSGYDLWIMKADGTDQARINALPDAQIHPAWTADGRILFSWSGGIYVVNTDGSDLRPLSIPSGASDFAPVWRP